ncbi:helix-turn-helix transcriptional regulator [Undibacterium sp. Ji49W]|uniref:helix-turn-helix transcriptional regulator n=1 Tax=Undibacterium sp. Ji49W TaxID=3413040 RepID=UPI003BF47B94
MLLDLNTVFHSELLSIRHGIARPSPDGASNIECESADLILLPIKGVFAKHDGPRQHFIANPNHGILLGAGRPYRISFLDQVGDESLVLDFPKEVLASLLAEAVAGEDFGSSSLAPHCLLSPASVMNRELLWRHLRQAVVDPLAVEEISLAMLTGALQAASVRGRLSDRGKQSVTMARRRQQVETVKELISLHSNQDWTLTSLARHAHTSPFHLARVFREQVGVPVHRYLIRTRLGKALEAMQSAELDFAAIAHANGFASHSHFTSSFRSLFGLTPSQSRQRMAIY